MQELEFKLEGYDFIELNKLLKKMHVANSGGQASLMISDGIVELNGAVETRKRKKLVKGDVISMDDIIIRVV